MSYFVELHVVVMCNDRCVLYFIIRAARQLFRLRQTASEGNAYFETLVILHISMSKRKADDIGQHVSTDTDAEAKDNGPSSHLMTPSSHHRPQILPQRKAHHQILLIVQILLIPMRKKMMVVWILRKKGTTH